MLFAYNKCARLKVEMTDTPVAFLIKFPLFVADFNQFWKL